MNEDKRKLKNISKHKWTNPNSFSATTAVLAFLTIIVVFALIQFVLSPLLSNLVQGSIGYGASLCISALISQAIILFVAWIFCKICHVKMFGGGISLKFDFKICIPALTLSLGTLLFIAPLHTKFSNGISYFQVWFTTSNSLSDITSNLSIADMVWLVVYALVIAPFLPAFCEEALFRGVIMNGLKEFGIFFATMASGLIFALMHGNYSQLILQFLINI